MADESSDYNWIAKRLIEDPDDMVGALAYALYKRHKIDYLKSYASRNSGAVPSEEALKAFYISTNTDTFENSLRAQAEVMLNKFLEQVLAGQFIEMQEKLKDSTFVTTSKDVENNLCQQIAMSKELFNSEISKVLSALEARKGWMGWGRDLATNFLVNMLTIIVIGAIAVGVAKIDAISNYLKQAVETSAKP
jgi:hypothetical protein